MASNLVVWRAPKNFTPRDMAPRWGLAGWRQRREEAELARIDDDARCASQLVAQARQSRLSSALLPTSQLEAAIWPASNTLSGLRPAERTPVSRDEVPAFCAILSQPLEGQRLTQMPAVALDRLFAHAIDGCFSGMDGQVPLSLRPLGLALVELQQRAERRLNQPTQSFLLRLTTQYLLDDAEEGRLAARARSGTPVWPSEAIRRQWHDHRDNLFLVVSGVRHGDDHELQHSIGSWLQLSVLLLLPLTLVSLLRLPTFELRA